MQIHYTVSSVPIENQKWPPKTVETSASPEKGDSHALYIFSVHMSDTSSVVFIAHDLYLCKLLHVGISCAI